MKRRVNDFPRMSAISGDDTKEDGTPTCEVSVECSVGKQKIKTKTCSEEHQRKEKVSYTKRVNLYVKYSIKEKFLYFFFNYKKNYP